MKLAPKIQIGPVGGGTSKPLKVTVQTSPSICDCWSQKDKYVVSRRPVLNNNPSFRIVLEHRYQSKGHVFPLTCGDIHPSQQFWCELSRFGEGHRDVCLLSDVMVLNATRLVVLRENTIENSRNVSSQKSWPGNSSSSTDLVVSSFSRSYFLSLSLCWRKIANVTVSWRNHH